MNTQIKRLIQLFCIMIMLFATLLPAIYSIQTAQASTPLSQERIYDDGDDEDDDDDDDDYDDDDYDDDDYDDDDNEIYGAIVSFPSNLLGVWQIGSMSFTANQNTRFEQYNSLFAVGMIVEVKYVVIDGVNVATKIESEDSHDDNDSHSSHDNEIYGIIASFPSDLLGTWQVGGMSVIADQNTRFDQNRSPFTVGLIVEVEYIISNGINIATKIESDNDYINQNKAPASGLITQMGGITAASTDNSSTWVIGGLSYQVTASTKLDGDLAVGKMALVSSYVDPNGTLNASQVTGTAVDNHIYLPMVLL